MKLSEELKIKRTEKVARMQAILDARKENGTLRAATTDETTEYNGLKAEVTGLDTDITEAEDLETRGAEPPIKRSFNIGGKADKTYNLGKAMREYINNKGDVNALTGLEKEIYQDMRHYIPGSEGLLVPDQLFRSSTLSTNAGSIDVSIIPQISIVEGELFYDNMGFTMMPGLQGTFKIGRKDADEADEYDEGEETTQTGNKATFRTMSPIAFSITDNYTKELLMQENPQVHQAYMADLVMGCKRKATKHAYGVLLAAAAANETAAATLSDEGLLAIMAKVPSGGAFAMNRNTFFEGAAVKADAGSGKFLFGFNPGGQDNGQGLTHRGTKAMYSELFVDGTNKKYICYGKMSEIWFGEWGAVEILVDPYTLSTSRKIRLTVSKFAKAVSRNDAAFSRTPDLDATT